MSSWPHHIKQPCLCHCHLINGKVLEPFKKREKKERTPCFLIDDKVQSLTISNKPARGLDTGREIEKIKEAISYSTNFISYFPTKGKGKKKKQPGVCQILSVFNNVSKKKHVGETD